MKNFKKIAYVFSILFIIVLSIFVYSNISKASEANSNIREKTLSEIQYFESKLIYMFNSLNNIEFENYKIYSQDISENSKKSSESSTSAGSSEGDTSSLDTSGNQSYSNNNSSDNTKKYSLNSKGILSSKDSINWNYIKDEAEKLQSSLSIMTLDLYEISLNNADILNFNKEYDNLLIQIKNENKEETLKQLNILYSYIPKFIRNCNTDDQYRIIINTKLNIFNAYSILDGDDWSKISKNIQVANETFSKLLTDVNLKNKNQSSINRCYILINGLQNSVETKDKEIFLIKYRNLLEELNNL